MFTVKEYKLQRSQISCLLVQHRKKANSVISPVIICTHYFSSSQLEKFLCHLFTSLGIPGGSAVKNPAYQCRRHRRCGFDPWVRKIPWRRKRQPTPVSLPGKSHEQRSLVGYSPGDCKELDKTEATQHSTHKGPLYSRLK